MRSQLGDYCLESVAAGASRFALEAGAAGGAAKWSTQWEQGGNGPGQGELSYAYHLDAGLYAAFLRRRAEAHGLRRIEGRIKEVRRHGESGDIAALVLDDDRVVEGDLFIDCTGFRGLLIEQTLGTGYEDWTHWLPCDRAVAVQTESVGPAVPYTQAIAHDAGWRWRIPLQHRVGNGWVFCSRHMSEDEAVSRTLAAVQGEVLRGPNLIPFGAGRRRLAWNRNVVALGLASGFIEPLESTSIHFVLSGVARLIHLFPSHGIDAALVAQYNAACRAEVEHVRDFIILHYHANQREQPMWRECREMRLPDSLAQRIAAFRERAHAWQGDDELFRLDSWLHVMLGQGIEPRDHHPLARALPDADLAHLLEAIRTPIRRRVESMPSHQAFLDRYCAARSAATT
jgi:tryptophan halogenase